MSAISICNIALGFLGADSIRDFDQSNKRARACEIMYPHARDTILSQYDWSFARRIVELREVADGVEVQALGKPFEIPANCLRPIDLYPEGTRDSWEVIGGYIYTRHPAPVLRYTAKEDNTGRYTTSFKNALAFMLAFYLAPTIRADKNFEKDFEAKSSVALLLAQEEDAGRGTEYLHPDRDPNDDAFVNPDHPMMRFNGGGF